MMQGATAERIRFEYGRHETFPVRYGWLGKGMDRVRATTAFRGDLDDADALGIGSRMARSLHYWLDAFGLVAYEPDAAGGRRKLARLSTLAEVIGTRDRYLEYPATWFFLHLTLARRAGSVWSWFFNDFPERLFDRIGAVDAFRTHARSHAIREPSPAVAQRDVACLLLTYAAPAAGETADPEDASVSPLRDLGLVIRHPDTDRFERTRPMDGIPLEAFLGCVAAMLAETGDASASVGELARRRNSPGRLLVMSGEEIDTAARTAAELHGAAGVQFQLLGGERRLTLPSDPPLAWLARHYDRIGAAQ